MNTRLFFLGAAVAFALVSAGCLTVKTEHEVKPVHITMDINLKVDQQINSAMNEGSKPDIKRMLKSGAIGLDKNSLLAPRAALTSEEMEFVYKSNTEHKARMAKIAEENGITVDEVASRGVAMFVERAEPGLWYQNKAGEWVQKK